MLGGSLTRYHTPTMEGRGFIRDLVKLAGPSVVHSMGRGLDTLEKGASAAEALGEAGDVLKRGLKRKIPAAIGLPVKSQATQAYKKKRQRVKDILGV